MAEVDVAVNGRSYRVACKDGEEAHLVQLSEHLDGHARELATNLGKVGEARLMLMAGLMVGDDLSTALDRVEELERQAAVLRAERDRARTEAAAAVRAVGTAADRIEALAADIATA